MDTLELNIRVSPRDPWAEILIAELAELGFDSFVETTDGVLAYGPGTLAWRTIVNQTSANKTPEVSLTITETLIPFENWNASWEANFDPVYVEPYVTIVAPFHDEEVVRGDKVIIQPQMSFGTGHHQTTRLMASFLYEMTMPDEVLDMGTGTGVLAIIAEKRGAKRILAVDIEDWSVDNAILNAALNDCHKIEVLCGDIDVVQDRSFGLIIANINKNVLKSHMKRYAELLEPQGILLLSGFFTTDCDELTELCAQFGLKMEETKNEMEWAALRLSKK